MAIDHPGPYLLLTLTRSGGWDGDNQDVEPTLRRVESDADLADLYIGHAGHDLTDGDVRIYDAADLATIPPACVAALRERVAKWKEKVAAYYAESQADHERAELARLLAKYPDAAKEGR